MARVIPRNSPADLLGFVTSHINTWENDPSAVGLSQQTIDDLRIARDELRAADSAAVKIRNQSRAATARKRRAFQDLYKDAAAAVSVIKAHAKSAATPTSVLATAQIPLPDQPNPRPAPPAPRKVRATLTGKGTVHVSWRCVGERDYTPGGSDDVFFSVLRTMRYADGRFEDQREIGSTGGRSFVDDGVRIGAAQVMYTIVARRGEKQSPLSNAASIRFGTQAPLSMQQAA